VQGLPSFVGSTKKLLIPKNKMRVRRFLFRIIGKYFYRDFWLWYFYNHDVGAERSQRGGQVAGGVQPQGPDAPTQSS
jgi:hypothetical protein